MGDSASDAALIALGRALRERGYSFVTPTPLTHARVLARPFEPANATLRDVFGWNRPFARSALPEDMFGWLRDADALAQAGDSYCSRIRFSSLQGMVFLHSGFPTSETDAVFFGPDTYRFARAIAAARDAHPDLQPKRIVDIGAGSGAGGLVAAALFSAAPGGHILLTDINAKALRFAAINAAINGIAAETRTSDVLANVSEPPDLVLANPPYLLDAKARTYRHGGGRWGTELSLRILKESLARLSPGGVLVLYTGTPVVDGVDVFHREAEPLLEHFDGAYRYDAMDPDVFGEELDFPPYTTADRITVIVITARAAATETFRAA